MTVCRRWWVAGRVQGVSFRAATRSEAHALGLIGYARNLADGRVEVYACGSQVAIAALDAWLHQGPPVARVDDLKMLEAACEEGLDGFEIRF
ncbi:acylphosphatase [Acidihalobacter aeolianus]|uniref:Acylphosphatase n=1 Tax=Acidihalobacter aeolianus TaxID=2792603 RepID=A0A1D8K995_9GAMM|nr:acylphosphatase [Acidihalobacter aeolianus]AOV17527.1 acylphosphatase [Acidihalobacter aeolianus]